ncbi:DUF1186 domain-containing protein [Jiella sonneratiae]|uniref:DUF1186 domain-containing protein n=1 Tax=Jiella sonneratiae TaxID=2816856 RepID=A0ABS3J2L6_9HYPH|nr:DUF1186 domain-containing protein [Jiella sonneratiae]MBO0903899.1 DUF1186 domain-containing protein [Jiella sonneratiae]
MSDLQDEPGPKLLEELAFHIDSPPYGAIAEARRRREEMVPAFLARIERAAAASDEDEWLDRRAPLFNMVHLLAEWGEMAAWLPLLRLFAARPRSFEDIFGDDTMVARAVMLSLFDGELAPLEALILDERQAEFDRWIFIEILGRLATQGRTDRGRVEDFVRSLDERLTPRRDYAAWDGWMTTVAALGLADMRESVARAIAEERITDVGVTIEDFDKDIAHAQAHPDAPWPSFTSFPELQRLEDVLNAYADIARKSRRYERKRRAEGHVDMASLGGVFGERGPAVNPRRDVGRNDPCPCGSGKKFKKCCLGKAAAFT